YERLVKLDETLKDSCRPSRERGGGRSERGEPVRAPAWFLENLRGRSAAGSKAAAVRLIMGVLAFWESVSLPPGGSRIGSGRRSWERAQDRPPNDSPRLTSASRDRNPLPRRCRARSPGCPSTLMGDPQPDRNRSSHGPAG